MKHLDATLTAKVLIIGDSGVGKSGLALRLQNNIFKPTESTHGFPISHILESKIFFGGVIDLWDFGGQPDYNLLYQLKMKGANAALLVIDETNPDLEKSIDYWMSLLKSVCPDLHSILLVSARVDIGTVQPEQQLKDVVKNLGFTGFFRTSAKTGEGINDLTKALFNAIEWSHLPKTITTLTCRSLIRDIRELMHNGDQILSLEDIQNKFVHKKYDPNDILAALNLMHENGEVHLFQPRSDTNFILLSFDSLENYSNSIILTAKKNTKCPNILDEAAVLRANVDFTNFRRLPVKDERLILDLVVEMLVRSNVCFRENGKLIFTQSPKQKINCFLCHASEDKSIADEIDKRLLEDGIKAWIDSREILPGESLSSKIEEALKKTNVFIILMSQNSMKSKWVEDELRVAFQKRREDSHFTIIPVLVEKCDIPLFLKDDCYVDWRLPTEISYNSLYESIIKNTKKK